MLARQTQARLWNRISLNFPQTQGPVARREFRVSLRFCAPKMLCPVHGVTPVMGSGADSPCQGEMARRARGGRVGDYEHEVLIWSRPRRRFAQSLVAPGEAQRSGFAGKRRSKGTNAVFAARRKRSGVDFATTSRRGQSHSPPAGGETPLRNQYVESEQTASIPPMERLKNSAGPSCRCPLPWVRAGPGADRPWG